LRRALHLVIALTLIAAPIVATPAHADTFEHEADFRHVSDYFLFLLGAGTGFVAHEFGHVMANLAFGTSISFVEVKLGPIPFFAIQPCCNLSRREEYAIASAGNVAQDIGSEIILHLSPRIITERHSFQKGMLAFHVLLSAGYAITGFAGIGPPQSDVNSMARGLGIQPWKIGLWLMIPAVTDTYRYFFPDTKWAPWVSASSKLAVVGASFTF
jgi:hypothetical protein